MMGLTRGIGLVGGAVILCLGLEEPARAYEETTVTDGGTLVGKITLDGETPKPKGYNLTTLPDPVYCGRISD